MSCKLIRVKCIADFIIFWKKNKNKSKNRKKTKKIVFTFISGQTCNNDNDKVKRFNKIIFSEGAIFKII